MKTFLSYLTERRDYDQPDLHHRIIDATHLSVGELHNKIKTGLANSPAYQPAGDRAGLFSTVHPHVGGSHVVKLSKSYIENPVNDPYIEFAKESQRRIGDSIHLPRIHSITSYRARNGTVHVTKMEPLEELHSASRKDMAAMHSSMFATEPTEYDELPPSIGGKHTRAAELLNQHVDLAHYHMNRENIRPKSNGLGVAFDVINKVRRRIQADRPSDSIRTDLHDKNMMVRRTATGPQLVITDPLVSKDDIHRTLSAPIYR